MYSISQKFDLVDIQVIKMRHVFETLKQLGCPRQKQSI
jgi:hypothetical protein